MSAVGFASCTRDQPGAAARHQLEAAVAEAEAAQAADRSTDTEQRTVRLNRNWGSLPANLRGVEVLVDIVVRIR